MHGLCSAECLIFRAAGRFVADKVRIRPAQTGGPDCLVSVDHNVMLCRFCNSIEIMVYHPLSVMVFATRKNIADIAGFNSIISILVHQLVCLFHMTLIVPYRR